MSKKKPSKDKTDNARASHRPAADALPTPPTLNDVRSLERVMSDLQASLTGKRKGNSLDEAQDLVYSAWENSSPKERVAMAFKALAISPDCADAYVVLAEAAPDPSEALSFFLLGVSAGKRAIGKKAFKEYTGDFWGILETRPYMRARLGLANCLWDTGLLEEAATNYQELLRLNPNDNQGVRDVLAACLLELGKDEALGELLKRYEDDGSATWRYTRAILAFRKHGDSTESCDALTDALAYNPHVPPFLLGTKRIPHEPPPFIGMGDENEAVHYAWANLEGWKLTKGALAWLETRVKRK